MTSFYLGLALAIALTLNSRWAPLRAVATLAAAIALGFLAWSIVLANQDGTFAHAPRGSAMPLLLNLEAGLAVAAAALLLAFLPRQWRRASAPVPLLGSRAAHGAITRALHWGSAVLIIAALTMGQFVAVLEPDNPLRAEFLGSHMAVGGAVFLLGFGRMLARLWSPAPPTRTAVSLAHFLLYALITAFCVTGLALTPAPVALLGLSLPNLPPDPVAAPLHSRVLPLFFALLFAAHLGGAIRAIRRMAA